MSIGRRVKDLTKATLGEMLEKSEDPVRSIDQYLYDQKRKLNELEQLYREQLQHAYHVKGQLKDAVELAEKREKQAELAVRAGEEELAKIALEDKLKQLDKASRYESLARQSKETTLELEERIASLKADIEEVSEQKQFYADRMESIRLQQKMNERQGEGGNHTFSWFNRLENLVQELEIETNVFSEMKGFRADRSYKSESVRSALDAEFEKLKKKMEGGDGK